MGSRRIPGELGEYNSNRQMLQFLALPALQKTLVIFFTDLLGDLALKGGRFLVNVLSSLFPMKRKARKLED